MTENSKQAQTDEIGFAVLADLVGRGVESGSIVFQGLMTLISGWIQAFGRACSAADTPEGLAGLATFLIANALALNYFATTEPYRTLLDKLKLLPLISQLSGLQVGGLLESLLGRFTGTLVDGVPQGNPPGNAPDRSIVYYGIQVVNLGVRVPGRDRLYTNPASQEAAFVISQTPGLGVLLGDLAPNGPGTGYEKYYVWNQGNGWIKSSSLFSTGTVSTLQPGKWGVFGTFNGQRVALSINYDTQALAQARVGDYANIPGLTGVHVEGPG